MSLLTTEQPKTTTSTKSNKTPQMKYFLGESGYHITINDNLVATGMVTKEKIEKVLHRKDLLLSECDGKSLVLACIAPNGLIKNIGYFSTNSGKELFKEDIEMAYDVIKSNPLIEAVSNEDFITSW